jgi:basic amino acid/polyamine antiporter, APA family
LAKPETLARVLGLRDLILIVIGTVIGSGIFLVPGGVLRLAGGYPGPALIVWVVGGALSLLGALAYGELGAMNPEAGGLYVYLRDAFGPLTAFLYGWTFFLVIATGSAATLAVASGSYLQQFIALGPAGQKIAAILLLAIVAAINVSGTRRSADVQNWSTAIKVAALLIMSVGLLVARKSAPAAHAPFWPAAFTPSLASGMGLGMIGVLWAYEGWQYSTFSAGETENPERTFPRGIAIGTACIVGIYMLANVGYLAAIGPSGVAASQAVAADAVNSVFGPAAAKLIAVAIMISMFSAANGITITSPRVYYKMARDEVFFKRLGNVHPKFGTPAFSIIASSAIAMVLAASGTFEVLLTYVVFAGWIFYALGAASIFVFRRRLPNAPRPYRVPGYPITPILFVLSAAAIVLNTLFTQPGRALVGVAVVLTGVPAYFVWRKRVG